MAGFAAGKAGSYLFVAKAVAVLTALSSQGRVSTARCARYGESAAVTKPLGCSTAFERARSNSQAFVSLLSLWRLVAMQDVPHSFAGAGSSGGSSIDTAGPLHDPG